MKIYINNFETPVKAEILPSYTPTKDETLETFSFALISNKNPIPYAPMQKVKVDFKGDDTDVAYFYIVSDSVETYSLSPLRYKHNISCIQNTRELSKHLVRNSVFAQPSNPHRESFNSFDCTYHLTATAGWQFDSWQDSNYNHVVLNAVSQPLVLSSREKIASAKIVLQLRTLITDPNNPYGTSSWNENVHTLSDFIRPSGTTIRGVERLILRYINNNNITENLYLEPDDFGLTEFTFNKPMDLGSIIIPLAANGYHDFQIIFETYDDSDPDNYYVNLPIQVSGQGSQTPTDTYTSEYIITARIEAEVYYYNCADILNLLIERQKKETSINSLPALFSLPQSGVLRELLEKTIAPNFTFTQLTMYECVAEVFRLFDAIFTMDEEGVLGIEYFNDQENVEEIEPKLTGRTLALGEDKYTNGLVSYYQDARPTLVFPNEKEFTNLRCEEYGLVDSDSGAHSIILPFPISQIVKVEMLYPIKPRFETCIENQVIDITRWFLERDIWSTLTEVPSGNSFFSDSWALGQANTIYFNKNTNAIPVSYAGKVTWKQGASGTTYYALALLLSAALSLLRGGTVYLGAEDAFTEDWKSYRFRVTYVASVDGETKVHSLTPKYEGETLVDQYNGAVDLNKMGLNMLGLALKLGNPTLNAGHKISRWVDRIKVGQIYRWRDAIWVANVVNYTFMHGCIQGKVSFVQNFNELALRTQLLREKRMSNISKELTQKSEEIITDYVYLTTALNYKEMDTIHFDIDALKELFASSFKDIGTEYEIGEAVVYKKPTYSIIEVPAKYIPMVRYGAGNTINFEMSFSSPMSAGNQTSSVSGAWFGSSNYYTKPVLYTEDDGFMDVTEVSTPQEVPDRSGYRIFPRVDLYNENSYPEQSKYYFKISEYKVYKQPNEIFALNYQLAFLPVPGRENIDFIGSQFINDNAFVHAPKEDKRCWICFRNKKSSVLDTKATPYFLKREITDIQFASSSTFYSIIFSFAQITTEERDAALSWALVDENNNVLFASNRKPSSRSDVYIYLKPRLSRIE